MEQNPPVKYDVVIIGGGPGGYAAALYGASAGLKIAIVEKDKVGGSCLHRGCIPAKELLESAAVNRTVRHAAEFGVFVDEPKIDWSVTVDRKQRVIDQMWGGLKQLLGGRKVDVYAGTGTLGPSHQVHVAGNDGTETMLIGTSVILATGSVPRTIPGFEPDGRVVFTSDEFLDLRTLPLRAAVIGGGAIGCEFASTLADMGTEVTILEGLPKILPGCDKDVAAIVERSFKKKGMTIRTGVSVTGHAPKADGGTVAKTALSVLRPGAVIAADIDIGGGVPAIDGKVAACRHRLTADEAVRFRRLGSDAGAAMRRAIDTFEPGDTEIAIAETIRHELALAGAVSVVTLVAADDRIKRFRHPVPTADRWRRTLLAVTCAQRGGLIVSLSRMVTLGTPDEELITRTQAAADVFAALRHATRPGAIGRELYEAAESAYRAAGFPDEIGLHHQGGAAGYKTRDWVAHPSSSEEVKLGQAFAWNPSITGTKVEETCILTDDGTDVVTASPDFPMIGTMIGGTEYLSPGILSL